VDRQPSVIESPNATIVPLVAGPAWTSTSSRKYQCWLVIVKPAADWLPA